MPKLKKGHKLGFQLNNMPQNKSEKKCKNDFILPPILRLDEEVKWISGESCITVRRGRNGISDKLPETPATGRIIKRGACCRNGAS